LQICVDAIVGRYGLANLDPYLDPTETVLEDEVADFSRQAQEWRMIAVTGRTTQAVSANHARSVRQVYLQICAGKTHKFFDVLSLESVLCLLGLHKILVSKCFLEALDFLLVRKLESVS